MQVKAVPVGDGLTIVIVPLLAEAERCEGDGIVRRDIDIVDASACGGCKAEVLCNDRQRVGLVAPVGVVDGGEAVMVVTAPL
jgi:hypothetical protein